ncbi:hypothetical protein E1B28_012664 [Marasmius oreades]|uniref:Amidohydrolase-related domain-containing protein n=1 Tax=Marasmius oreades TaxID=181124 RepID=A0A9P7RS24_9AGAR|nr:uncharacterized protein E1B28_012664 [Marasmius oreades]KAG7088694.1 hypothetical protein E1B28_012664 [Marasmius oreades]
MVRISPIALFQLLLVSTSLGNSCIRRGRGSIILEEHWVSTEESKSITSATIPYGQTIEEFQLNIADIHNQRLQTMDDNHIDYMVLSYGSPGIQGISDPEKALATATEINNRMAGLISNNTQRFGVFAALPMHNASLASQELRRAVTELGFVGAMIHDYQQSGPDNGTLYYDRAGYDEFWKTVSELDIPVYFHPRLNTPALSGPIYKDAPWLRGAIQEFAVTLSNHILRLCVNGVFDRFPDVKIIVGHMGERLSSDLYRIERTLRAQLTPGLPMQQKLSWYWQRNIYETTSGDFTTPLFRFHRQQLGISRMLFSVDYPFEPIGEASEWLESLSEILSVGELYALRRGNAMKLLKLKEC